jgi:hypothetical protein
MRKAGRPIFFLRAKKLAVAIFIGVTTATLGTLLHNSYSPVGLVITFVGSFYAFKYFGKQVPGKFLHLIAISAWLLVALKAASFGVSQEVLIEGNINGFVFLLGGIFINFFGLSRAKRG